MITAMTTLLILLIALVVVEIIDRLVALVASDGLGHRPASTLPRSHYRPDVLDRELLQSR